MSSLFVERRQGPKSSSCRHEGITALSALAILLATVAYGAFRWGNSGLLNLPCHKAPHHSPSPHSKGSATSGHIFSGEKIRDFRPPGPLPDPCTLPKLGAQCKNWAVLTTINNVTESVLNTCNHLRDWCMVVVADNKTPREYSALGACTMIFIDVEMQHNWSSSCALVAELPWNHFSRKNIGYLVAIVNGAERVWDFDDDNELLGPHPTSLEESPISAWTLPAHRNDVLNPYPLLGASTFAWPRGFPLSRINDNGTTPSREAVLEGQWAARRIAVVQSLAQGSDSPR